MLVLLSAVRVLASKSTALDQTEFGSAYRCSVTFFSQPHLSELTPLCAACSLSDCDNHNRSETHSLTIGEWIVVCREFDLNFIQVCILSDG